MNENQKEIQGTTQLVQRVFSTKEVKHGLSLFSNEELEYIEKLMGEKEGKLFIKCQIRNEVKLASPEEVVRQLFIYRVISEYGYPKVQIKVEEPIRFGSNRTGFADIVVTDKDLRKFIIFEIKRPKRKEGLKQLESYCNATGAPIGVWSNGDEIVIIRREEPNFFTFFPRIPKVTETLEDVLKDRWSFKKLEECDELKKGKTTLKKIIVDLEELVLGNAGVDPFEEIFKLIYAKLYDEWRGIHEEEYQLEFFVGDRKPEQVKEAIENLFEKAKEQWKGIFEPTDKIKLGAEHLTVCVSHLEKVKLFNSDLQIIDEAFEYLVPQVSKKKEGQFFTPRPVVNMIVKMLNPKYYETVIDPACGSGGFLLHSMLWIAGGKTVTDKLPEKAKDFIQNRAFGIDFSEKAVKIAKALNLIAGDGKAHIYKANSLAPHTWDDTTKGGLRERLLRFENPKEDEENQKNFIYFDFDVLMTNPPFAGTVKEEKVLELYNLAKKGGRLVNKIDRHILFLERSLHFLRPGGRMAIILPQGVFNNLSAEYIRRFIMKQARILAVVGLHENTFKPHTGTKTSILFLQKYSDKEKEKIYQLEAKYESEFEEYFKRLQRIYRNCSWESQIDEEELPEELRAFLESYFFLTEETENSESKNIEVEENVLEEKEVSPEEKVSLKELICEYRKTVEVLEKKKAELKKVDIQKAREVGKEIRELNKERKRLHREILQRTLGGQIWLVLNDKKIKKEFKKFWVEGKIMKKVDYPIFMAVNEKPIKDNRGEYRYKRNLDGSFVLDEYKRLIIDHDLNEIAEAFIRFAKEQKFDFWRE
ncbi:MAG: N-6 DNA methylase [Candidatus Aenigmatarchaeota archaeon]